MTVLKTENLRKSLTCGLLSLSLIASLAACGGQTATGTPATDTVATETPADPPATDTVAAETPAENPATDTVATETPAGNPATDTVSTETPAGNPATDTVSTETPADETQSTVIGSANEKRKIIIDTDTGADDASALILAAKDPDIEIVGVTVLVGNVDLEQSTKNALMAMEIAGCDAPVYKGSADTFDGTIKTAFSVFGNDGMGDAGIINPSRQADEGDAIDFMIETVKNNPGEIEIVALGPATNIAKAITKDPEAMKNVKRIWSMGTAGLGPGNASPVAEFNVYADAEAYRIMLDSGLPITVIGLDMCDGDAQWTDEQFEQLNADGEIGKFVAASFGKIRDFYKSNGSGTVMNCDCLAMMCALYPDFVKDRINTHASCITADGETYALVIFSKKASLTMSQPTISPTMLNL